MKFCLQAPVGIVQQGPSLTDLEFFTEGLHSERLQNAKEEGSQIFPSEKLSSLSHSELYGFDCETTDNIQHQSSAETYDYMGD